MKEADHDYRGGHSSTPSLTLLQRTSEEVTFAAADHVVLARSHDATADGHANEHGQKHQAERVMPISDKSNVKERVWVVTAEMVHKSTLISVDIDILCHLKRHAGVEESNVSVKAVLGKGPLTITSISCFDCLDCTKHLANIWFTD